MPRIAHSFNPFRPGIETIERNIAQLDLRTLRSGMPGGASQTVRNNVIKLSPTPARNSHCIFRRNLVVS
jgi:hypothetical protein